MKTVILAAMTVIPLLSQAQKTSQLTPLPDNGVYMTAADFTHRKVVDGFDNGQPGYRLHDELLKNAVKIVQPANKEIEIPVDNLWGERIKDVDYRRFNGDLYRVEHADRVFVYSKVSNFNQTNRPLYFFSRKADSPIYLISTTNLDNVYYDQPEKKALFENMDDLSDNPQHQAVTLTHLFYSTGTNDQRAASAE